MRYKIYKILQKYLHRVGIYTQYYPSDKAIHYHLKSKPIIIQNYELNKVSNTLRAANNHAFYSSLLKRFVPMWNVKIKEPSFVMGGGMGSSSLNCFRKVKIEDTYFFEKVYFTQNDDLKRIKWFSENARDILSSYGAVAPKLHSMYEGDAFMIVYFEFLNLRPLDISEIEMNFISLVKKLYRASVDKDNTIIKKDIPAYIKDYKNHFEYKNKISQATNILSSHGISTQNIEKDVINSTLILTHGDIQEKNAFKDFMLIDWDTFGLYPIGFDVAFLCFRLLITNKMKSVSSTWLEINFKNDINSEHWTDFERNFNYFLSVFLATYFKKESYKALEIRLVEKLKQYDS